MTKASLRASAAAGAFAHLLGIQAKKPAGGKSEKDDREEPDEDDDSGAEDDRDPAEGSESDDDAGEDDDDKKKDGKKGKKAKKAKASDDDKEECDEEMSDDEDVADAARAGREFERARCQAIFAAPSAGVRPDIAAHLAFSTGMSAGSAIALLDATAAGGAAPSRRESLAARPRVQLGGGSDTAAPTGPKGLAAQIVAAGKKRRGEA